MALASPFRLLTLICLASAGWAFSFGVGTQVVSHWLRAQGFSDSFIGLNHAAYYLGLALASPFLPWVMRRGGRWCAPAGMVLSGFTLGIFPWSDGPAGWLLLRLLSGAAAGMSLIPLETLISTISSPEQRARDFGFYSVALALGGALGIAAGLGEPFAWAGVHIHGEFAVRAFVLAGMPPLVGGMALLRGLPGQQASKSERGTLGKVDFQQHFLSYGSAWSQGFLEGGMLAFLSFFLISRGLSKDQTGSLMGVTMVGVILFQVPVAWLADRLGRVPVLLACYVVVLCGLIAVPLCGPSLWLALWLFVFGACSGAFYPLGLALLGEKACAQDLPRLFAWYMAIECVGSQMGAASMGKTRDWWGEPAMFAVGFVAVFGVLLGWGLLRLREFFRRRERTPVGAGCSAAPPEERQAA